MDLGYYSLCRWDVKAPVDFSVRRQADERNKINHLKSRTRQIRRNKDAEITTTPSGRGESGLGTERGNTSQDQY